uniref:Aquaporin 11 n=1 Tax=Naja naja TaxID=35670 RepID=A0A8C7DXZ3_NAJNA
SFLSSPAAMNTDDALISLLVMAGIILLVGACRQLAYRGLRRTTNWFNFAQELTATFQICVALWLTYIFTVLHGWTLAGSVGNPASSIQQFYKGQLGSAAWCLQTGALALIWMLGFTTGHSRALPDICSNPIQTTISNAFGLEFLFSFLLHLTLLQFQAMSPTMKVHLVALLITSFVYAGGHLTGAVFNPALAFSLHGSCFIDQFWNYLVVYCIAPCAGEGFFYFHIWTDKDP